METNYAVLHAKHKEPLKVYALAGRVHVSMLANVASFPNPDPSLSRLSAETKKLDTLMNSKDGNRSNIQAIKDQADLVYRLLKRECTYVNIVAQGDKTIIILSG